MTIKQTYQMIQHYYEAFNEGDMENFGSLLADDVVHDINQGQTEVGKEEFLKFMTHNELCYSEKVHDLIIMVNENGQNASAYFRVEGQYINTDNNLPQAKGQTYSLNVGSFFELQGNKISRVTTYYNMNEWLKQVA